MTATPPVSAGATPPIELQIWLSPTFPIGSFAYSHGLEWAVGTGRIECRTSAEAWLCDLIGHGAMRNDAILLTLAWRAMATGGAGELADLNALALAMAGSRERHLETTLQGNAFVRTVLAAWGDDRLAHLRTMSRCDVAYPIAVGSAAAARDIALPAVLRAFLTGTMLNFVSALVRLSVIGQTDGQHIIAALVPAISEAAARTEDSTLDDLGGAVFISDIAAIAHETQETRLFRS